LASGSRRGPDPVHSDSPASTPASLQSLGRNPNSRHRCSAGGATETGRSPQVPTADPPHSGPAWAVRETGGNLKEPGAPQPNVRGGVGRFRATERDQGDGAIQELICRGGLLVTESPPGGTPVEKPQSVSRREATSAMALRALRTEARRPQDPSGRKTPAGRISTAPKPSGPPGRAAEEKEPPP